jgi:hypothetical protein
MMRRAWHARCRQGGESQRTPKTLTPSVASVPLVNVGVIGSRTLSRGRFRAMVPTWLHNGT